MNQLPVSKQASVVASLVEGNSIRATERMSQVHRDTIMRLGVDAGEACGRLHDGFCSASSCCASPCAWRASGSP